VGIVQWALLIAVALAGLTGAASVHHQRRFRRDMARLARRLKLHYTPEDRLDLLARFDELPLVRQGHNRRTGHVITGATPYGSVTCFRLAYEIGSGGLREVRQWMLAVLETECDLPFLVLTPADDRDGATDVWSDLVSEDATEWTQQGPTRVWRHVLDDTATAAWPSGCAPVERTLAVLADKPTAFGLVLQGSRIAACSPTPGAAGIAEAAMDVVIEYARRVRDHLDSVGSDADAATE
jgi:hypothetical protein